MVKLSIQDKLALLDKAQELVDTVLENITNEDAEMYLLNASGDISDAIGLLYSEEWLYE